MLPQTTPRKKPSAKTDLLISAVFHGVIILLLAYFAAREGLLGEQLKKIAVEMVKEKPPEKPPEKPKEPDPDPDPEKPSEDELPEPEEQVLVEAPPVEVTPQEIQQTPPPATTTAAVAPPAAAFAPAAVNVPAFDFEGGARVQSTADPTAVYKNSLEYALRSRWNRPDGIEDRHFVAEVEVAIDSAGKISSPSWKKSSGNTRWDNSVRQAIAATPTVNRPPPANFPPRVLVRFDVQEVAEDVSSFP